MRRLWCAIGKAIVNGYNEVKFTVDFPDSSRILGYEVFGPIGMSSSSKVLVSNLLAGVYDEYLILRENGDSVRLGFLRGIALNQHHSIFLFPKLLES